MGIAMIGTGVEFELGVAVETGLVDGAAPAVEPVVGEVMPVPRAPAVPGLAPGAATRLTDATTTTATTMAPAMRKRRGRVDPRLGPACCVDRRKLKVASTCPGTGSGLAEGTPLQSARTVGEIG
jgi:hypothetical protein